MHASGWLTSKNVSGSCLDDDNDERNKHQKEFLTKYYLKIKKKTTHKKTDIS